MMPTAALICTAAALHATCAFSPKKAFCPVKACNTPAVTAYVPPEPADDPVVPADPLPEPPGEHPATAIDAAAATPQAASQRVLVCFIARASVHLRPAISRGRLCYTSLRNAEGEGLGFGNRATP